MAYGLQDVITLRQFVQDSSADDAHKRVEHHKLESMLGLCELISCRRQSLLGYFDEELAEPCGHCDNCLQALSSGMPVRRLKKHYPVFIVPINALV